MKRLIPLLLAGPALLPTASLSETLPLPLSGPAYVIADQAYAAYNRKEYDLAIAKAKEALRQRSDVVELRELIALAERERDQRKRPPVPPKPGYREATQALAAYDNGHYPEAVRHARKAIAQAPENLDYRLILIEALYRAQYLQQAQTATEDAIRVFGPLAPLQHRVQQINEQMAARMAAQGYDALNRGDSDKAVIDARDAVQRVPRQMTYRYLLVSSLTAQGQYQAAHLAATQALALDADDTILLVQRGQLSQRLGDQTAGRQDFARALATGKLSSIEQASLYAAMDKPHEALRSLHKARDAGELKPGDELRLAYLLSQTGDDRAALAEFERADRRAGLTPAQTQDAAYTALRAEHDEQAIAYFKKAIDEHRAGRLDMSRQQAFNTRRAVSDLSREWGLTSTTTYRGATTISGLGGAPTRRNDTAQNSTEVFWRPLGYRNARFIELYARATGTLWSKNSADDTGLDALQGAIGIRGKLFTDYNVVAAVERTFHQGRSDADDDWLLRLGYGSSIGTDLQVSEPSWWTSQFYAEAGRYLKDSRNYFNSEWQLGRSIRMDRISSRLVIFPHAVAAFTYDSKMRSKVNSRGNLRTFADEAGGMGAGVGARYWFRETRYKAPQSYVDFSIQYREKIFGDESAQGLFGRLTYSW